jgi:hypothetical protein
MGKNTPVISVMAGLRLLLSTVCNVHGFGGREVLVDLSQSKGDGYQVEARGK